MKHELIKELALQAGFYVAGDKIYIPTTCEDITTCQTKFAELIVGKCASKVDWILAEGGKTQGDLIKEHFGVEE